MSRKRYYLCAKASPAVCCLAGLPSWSSSKKSDLVPKKPDSNLKTYTHKTCIHGRNKVRWSPGQEASSVSLCSNLRSCGSKCTVLKKVLVTLLGLFGVPRSHSASAVIRRPGNCTPLASPLSALACRTKHKIDNKTRQKHRYNKFPILTKEERQVQISNSLKIFWHCRIFVRADIG